MAKKIKVRILKQMDEVYSEKQRKYMCAMTKQGADRPEGLSKAEAEEMCKDTDHSKLDEEWSKSERNKRKSKCDNPKGFTMKQFCKNQRTKSKKGEKKNE